MERLSFVAKYADLIEVGLAEDALEKYSTDQIIKALRCYANVLGQQT